jgi:hypothetical protein
MGVWGAGLYAGDFAQDLKSAATLLLRLPRTPDEILAELVALHPEEANAPTHEEHSTFWLVVADQMEKKGALAASARERALDIIRSRADAATMADLGLSGADLKRRAQALDRLAAQLEAPTQRKRSTLKKPPPMAFATGEIILAPTRGGQARNPYMPPSHYPADWVADGWFVAVILHAERLFEFFPWYGALVSARQQTEKPTRENVDDVALAYVWNIAVCSAGQAQRFHLERLGVVASLHPSRVDNAAKLAPVARQIVMADATFQFHERRGATPAVLVRELADPEHGPERTPP